MRNADAIAVPRHRRHIGNDKDRRRILRRAQKCEDRVGAIVSHRPHEPGGLAIALMQCRLAAVEPIEIAYHALNAGVRWIIDQKASRDRDRGSIRALARIRCP